MASISFILDKRQNSKGESNILIQYYLNTKRKRLRTGVKVKPMLWDQEGQRIKGSEKKVGHLNDTLTSLRTDMEKLRMESLRDDVPLTFERFEQKFLERVNRGGDAVVEIADEHKALHWAERWIEVRGKSVKASTVKTWKALVSHLEKYSKKRKRTVLVSDLVTQTFYHDLSDYLNYEVKVGDEFGLRPSSAGKVIKNLKLLIEYLKNEGVLSANLSLSFMKTKRNETFDIALNEDEVQAIEDLSFKNDDSQVREIIRDQFLVSCETALRYSDAGKLSKKNLTSDGLIAIQATKTVRSIYIPISPRLKRIMAKYNGGFPNYQNNQVFNREIKAIAEMAGVDDKVYTVDERGGRRKENVRRKYEMIKSHTGRRTFATIYFDKGKNVEDIMMITGHKSRKQFFEYIKRDEKDIKSRVGRFFE